MLKKRVYLDYAAGSLPNPSAIHAEGVAASKRLEGARQKIAAVIEARPDEIFMTSGGTEGNNLALFGLLEAGDHVISSLFEHPSVLEPLGRLQDMGVKVTYLKPDGRGLISGQAVKQALRPETKLVSLIYAQNEIGVIQDLNQIRRAIGKNILLHTDACQAPGLVPIEPKKLGVDLMTFNGHKIYAPASTGFLFVRRGMSLSLIHI